MQSFLQTLLEPTALNFTVELLLGIVTSFAVDWIPGFTELSARVKRIYWLIVPMLLALLAMVALSLLSHSAITGEDVFLALSVGALVFYGSQGAHTRTLSA